MVELRWSSGDELQLQAMLARKGRTEVEKDRWIVAETSETRMLMIESVLNEKLRPGQLPLLKYCRTQRLSLQLMADLQLVPVHHQMFVSVMHTMSGQLYIASEGFKSEKNRVKALMMAIGECSMKVLLAKGESHGTSTTNVGV